MLHSLKKKFVEKEVVQIIGSDEFIRHLAKRPAKSKLLPLGAFMLAGISTFAIAQQATPELAKNLPTIDVKADADKQAQVILADAYKKAQEMQGAGDAKAAAVYSGAYGQNAEFYSFYRSLDAYKATFKSKGDVMVLDPSSDFFKFLKQSGAKGK